MARTKFPVQLAAVVRDTAAPIGIGTVLVYITNLLEYKIVLLPLMLRGNISLVTTHAIGLL